MQGFEHLISRTWLYFGSIIFSLWNTQPWLQMFAGETSGKDVPIMTVKGEFELPYFNDPNKQFPVSIIQGKGLKLLSGGLMHFDIVRFIALDSGGQTNLVALASNSTYHAEKRILSSTSILEVKAFPDSFLVSGEGWMLYQPEGKLIMSNKVSARLADRGLRIASGYAELNIKSMDITFRKGVSLAGTNFFGNSEQLDLSFVRGEGKMELKELVGVGLVQICETDSNLAIECDRLEYQTAGLKSHGMAELCGNVHLSSKDFHGWCDKAILSLADKEMILTNSVRLIITPGETSLVHIPELPWLGSVTQLVVEANSLQVHRKNDPASKKKIVCSSEEGVNLKLATKEVGVVNVNAKSLFAEVAGNIVLGGGVKLTSKRVVLTGERLSISASGSICVDGPIEGKFDPFLLQSGGQEDRGSMTKWIAVGADSLKVDDNMTKLCGNVWLHYQWSNSGKIFIQGGSAEVNGYGQRRQVCINDVARFEYQSTNTTMRASAKKVLLTLGTTLPIEGLTCYGVSGFIACSDPFAKRLGEVRVRGDQLTVVQWNTENSPAVIILQGHTETEANGIQITADRISLDLLGGLAMLEGGPDIQLSGLRITGTDPIIFDFFSKHVVGSGRFEVSWAVEAARFVNSSRWLGAHSKDNEVERK